MPVYRVPVLVGFSDKGAPGVNVWHIRTSTESAANAAEGQAAVDSIHQFYADLAAGGGGLGPPFAASTSFTLGQIVNMETDATASATWSTITIGATGNDLPPANQICVSWRTSIAARRGTGRTFIGPLNTGVAAPDGSILSTVRNNVLTAATGLRSRNLTINGWAVGVWGLQSAGGDRQAPRVLRDITGATVGTSFAVLRSRRD